MDDHQQIVFNILADRSESLISENTGVEKQKVGIGKDFERSL